MRVTFISSAFAFTFHLAFGPENCLNRPFMLLKQPKMAVWSRYLGELTHSAVLLVNYAHYDHLCSFSRSAVVLVSSPLHAKIIETVHFWTRACLGTVFLRLGVQSLLESNLDKEGN